LNYIIYGCFELTDESEVIRRKTSTRLNLESFDMSRVLAHSSHLTGSEGSEYDLTISEGEQLSLPSQQEKLAAKLGFHPRLMGVDDLFTVEDLAPVQAPCMTQAATIPFDETLKQPGGLSRREMNRAKRKVLLHFQIFIYNQCFLRIIVVCANKC